MIKLKWILEIYKRKSNIEREKKQDDWKLKVN